MERLMFGSDFEVDAWSRFLRWNLIKICVWTCDINSTLGSVVPLAMFMIIKVVAVIRRPWGNCVYMVYSILSCNAVLQILICPIVKREPRNELAQLTQGWQKKFRFREQVIWKFSGDQIKQHSLHKVCSHHARALFFSKMNSSHK